MLSESEKSPESNETPQTPSQKLDAYIASLKDRHDFDIMDDRTYVLTVRRNPDATHSEPWPDDGWILKTVGHDKNGVKVGIVEKFLNPDDQAPARKRVTLQEAFRYSAEVARANTPQTELADSALRITGQEARSIIDSGAVKADVQVEVPVEAPAQQETAREMLDRYIRGYQSELSALYDQHRTVEPGSAEAVDLEYQIGLKKEDIGRADERRRNLS